MEKFVKKPMNPNAALFWKRLRQSLAVGLCLLFVGWIGYINRPRPEYEVSEIETQFATPNVTRVASHQAPTSQAPTSQAPTYQAPTHQAPTSQAIASQTEPIPFQVSVVYSPGYLIDLGGLERMHPFDIKKYQKIHQQLKADGLLTDEQTLKPAPLTDDDLLLIHTKQYLDDLKSRKNIAKYLEAGVLQFAPVSLDTAVVEPFRRASGGTLLAARQALKSGIGVNLGGGYHHAKPDKGEGFCLFADVPIAIRKLQNEKSIRRALIVDVDVHQGNGTIVCLSDDDSTFTFSMHQGNIYPIPKEVGDLDVELRAGTGDVEYLNELNKNLDRVLDQAKADICFIVGGCDTLNGDPLASLEMTPGGIVKRDHAIVKSCVDRKIPVVLTLSGGYSPDAWRSQYLSIKNLIETYQLYKPSKNTDVRDKAKKAN